MAYTINKSNGQILVVLEDGTIDTSTSIGLVGRNYVGYGETQNENFVFLLENFANEEPPTRPLTGQIWFNTSNNLSYVYDGTSWKVIGSAIISESAPNQSTLENPNPPEPTLGSLWLKTSTNALSIWNGTSWTFIGPEHVPGFATTRARSIALRDADGNNRPVILLETNGTVIAIATSVAFTINPDNSIPGFTNNLVAGINMSSSMKVKGDLLGNATTAERFLTPRTINGVTFSGETDITIKASTTKRLIKGQYLTGANFDGSVDVTLDVDASSSNLVGKVVVRNSEGGFAAGTITANLVGNVTGNVNSTGTSNFNIVTANQFVGASLTGNAFSATRLQTAREINNVSFDGTRDITITANAETLTGTFLNSNVTQSSLNSLGTLINLFVADAGVVVGGGNQLRMLVDSGTPTIRSITGELNFDTGPSGPDISFVNRNRAQTLGGDNAPAIIGDNTTNLGIPGYQFDNVYANNFRGNADTATLATSANNLTGGSVGAIPYQTTAGSTAFLNIGAEGYVLRSRNGNTLQWEPLSFESLTKGSYVNLINTATSATINTYNTGIPATISVDATPTNTANKVVARDVSGNFAAGTITANLVGTVTGNASTATRLQTARLINGVSFDGSANITVNATDPTKVNKTGDTMSGYLTLNANPVNPLHATPKQYVDSRLPQYTIQSGASSVVGFTNIVGSFNFNTNYFDVFPPAGKTMANLVAFIPSVNYIAFAGGVNGDDSMVCTYSYLGDRIRVYVQNTEQRAPAAANYLVIWS